MSAHRSHAYPMMAQPDGSGGDSGSPRARSTTPDHEDADTGEGTLGLTPPPLPADPKIRAELFARLERGMAEAQSGRGVDWEDLDRRMRAKYGL